MYGNDVVYLLYAISLYACTGLCSFFVENYTTWHWSNPGNYYATNETESKEYILIQRERQTEEEKNLHKRVMKVCLISNSSG